MTSMTVNGEPIRYTIDPATPLLWALRDASNLTGTKYGCDTGDCGACTVIVDGRATLSCGIAIAALEGAQVTTIEGLSRGGTHPLQQAWAAEQVTQCGMCDPGFIMALASLLRANPAPGHDDLAALPNLCRCGTGPRMLRAIVRAGQIARATAPRVVPGSVAAPPEPAP